MNNDDIQTMLNAYIELKSQRKRKSCNITPENIRDYYYQNEVFVFSTFSIFSFCIFYFIIQMLYVGYFAEFSTENEKYRLLILILLGVMLIYTIRQKIISRDDFIAFNRVGIVRLQNNRIIALNWDDILDIKCTLTTITTDFSKKYEHQMVIMGFGKRNNIVIDVHKIEHNNPELLMETIIYYWKGNSNSLF